MMMRCRGEHSVRLDKRDVGLQNATIELTKLLLNQPVETGKLLLEVDPQPLEPVGLDLRRGGGGSANGGG